MTPTTLPSDLNHPSHLTPYSARTCSCLAYGIPLPDQTSTSCVQETRGVVQMGRDHFHPAQNWVRSFMLSVKTGKKKLKKPLHSRCPFARSCGPSPGKDTNRSDESPWSCLVFRIFDVLSRRDQIAGVYQRPVMKMIVQFLQGVSCDSES